MRHKPTEPRRHQKQIDFLLQCDVPEVMYGGAAGGGKSDALLMAALQFVEVPGYAALLLRQTYKDLALPGALMERASNLLTGTGARWDGSEHVWTFPSGATLSFGYLEKETDRFRYQSSEFQFIGFDELTQFKDRDYLYLFSRLRRTADNQIPLRMRSGTNPGGVGHVWVKRRFLRGWDGVSSRHMTEPDRCFVQAKLDDNPYIDREEYEKALDKLDSQTRKQLRHGDWSDFAGNYYYPNAWPRYLDVGDAYRVRVGERWHHIRKADCSRILTLDWAMGKPKKDSLGNVKVGELTGDCTAFVVGDLADALDGRVFLLDAINERIPMANNAPRLAEMCRRWSPVVVAGDDDNLSETMHLECRRFPDIPLIKPVGIRSKNKLTRSQAAIVRAERGMLYLPEHAEPWVEALSDQLSAFTGADGMPDDIADCVSILGRLADEFSPGDAGDDYESLLGSSGYDGAW